MLFIDPGAATEPVRLPTEPAARVPARRVVEALIELAKADDAGGEMLADTIAGINTVGVAFNCGDVGDKDVFT